MSLLILNFLITVFLKIISNEFVIPEDLEYSSIPTFVFLRPLQLFILITYYLENRYILLLVFLFIPKGMILFFSIILATSFHIHPISFLGSSKSAH